MNPSGSKYLTPCRTFGLQRTHKRTSTPKGLTPKRRTSELSSLSTPFRSPLISKGVDSASPAGRDRPNSVGTTPLLPKSRVKMGLSKPFPKTPLVQSKVLILSDLIKSPSWSGSGQKQTSNKISAHTQSNTTPKTSQPVHPKSSIHSWDGEDDISEETDSKCPPAIELSLSARNEEVDDSPISSTVKKDPCGSESGDDEIIKVAKDPKKNSPNPQKSDNNQSQESFHGWDSDDNDSVNSDAKRDLFRKCISNMSCNDDIVHKSHCDKPELSVYLSKQKSGSSKSSKVRFRSKRRLLSDSDDSETNGNEIQDSARFETERNVISQSGGVTLLTSNDDDPPGKSVQNLISVSQKPKTQQDSGTDLFNSLKITDNIARRKPPPKRRILSDSDDDDVICPSNQLDKCVGSPAVDTWELGKCSTESSHSNAGLSSDSSENDREFTSAWETYSSRSRNKTIYGSSESEVENCENTSPLMKKKKRISVNRHEGGKCHSRISIISDSDDDHFLVKKPIQKELKASKRTSNPLKIKPVVELSRLPKLILNDVTNEGGTMPGQSSRCSPVDGEFTEKVAGSRSSFKIKTYGAASQNQKKSPLLNYARHISTNPSTLNEEKLRTPDKPINLEPITPVGPDGNDVVRQYIDAVSDTDDFERIKGEMHKWLIGGQLVISQIIEEVRRQRDKDMSVMEVLQEHNIDPDLVGYDPVVEDFVSFDTFLEKNNLSG